VGTAASFQCSREMGFSTEKALLAVLNSQPYLSCSWHPALPSRHQLSCGDRQGPTWNCQSLGSDSGKGDDSWLGMHRCAGRDGVEGRGSQRRELGEQELHLGDAWSLAEQPGERGRVSSTPYEWLNKFPAPGPPVYWAQEMQQCLNSRGSLSRRGDNGTHSA
jgi:hypothetical protein